MKFLVKSLKSPHLVSLNLAVLAFSLFGDCCLTIGLISIALLRHADFGQTLLVAVLLIVIYLTSFEIYCPEQ